MMNFKNREKSLPEKLSEDIIDFILSENLKSGDKLPNESTLSEKLDASRSTVREAMKLLASRNIISIKQGSGTYISKTPGIVDDPLGFIFIDDKNKLINDLMDIRFMLEPSIAELAAINATEEDVRKIISICNEVEEKLINGEDHTELDVEFHKAIALSSKNVVVPRLIPVIHSAIPLFIQSTGNILKKETIETHRDIANAIAEHNPIKAKDAMYLHLVYNRFYIKKSIEE